MLENMYKFSIIDHNYWSYPKFLYPPTDIINNFFLSLEAQNLAHLHAVSFLVRKYKVCCHSSFGLLNTKCYAQSVGLVWVNSVVKSLWNSSLTPLLSIGKEHTVRKTLFLLLVFLPAVLQIVSDSQYTWFSICALINLFVLSHTIQAKLDWNLLRSPG